MPKTDNPLKRLFTQRTLELATFFLNNVCSVTPLESELPEDTLRADQIYSVVTHDGKAFIWHVEFQAGTSNPPMPLRMLDYMARLYKRHGLSVHSLVLYIGNAGKGDTGRHGFDMVTIGNGDYGVQWCYEVIRLKEVEAAELLASPHPEMLCLLGLVSLTEPEVQVKQALDRLRQEADNREKRALMSIFSALMPTKELAQMIREQLEQDGMDWLLDLPAFQIVREESWEQGLQEGLQQGHQQGLEEGLERGIEKGREQGIEQGLEQGLEQGQQQGLEQGTLRTLKHAILKGILKRFKLDAEVYVAFEEKLQDTTDITLLNHMLETLIKAQTFDEVQTLLHDA